MQPSEDAGDPAVPQGRVENHCLDSSGAAPGEHLHKALVFCTPAQCYDQRDRA